MDKRIKNFKNSESDVLLEVPPLEVTVEKNDKSVKGKKEVLYKTLNYLKTFDDGYYFSEDKEIVDIIAPGIYTISRDTDNRYFLKKKTIELDELYDLKSAEFDLIRNDIVKFLQSKNHFQKYKFVFKRGYLLYGRQGIGKTSLINNLAMKFIAEGYDILIFHINNVNYLSTYVSFMNDIKDREPNKLFFIIFEDIDNMMGNEDEIEVINFLDGAGQIDGMVTFATTNYPEKLKERLTNRPSRFDRRVEVPLPNTNVREQYFINKFKTLDDSDIQKYSISDFVSDTEGFSLAHCGELFKSVIIFQNDYKETIKLLNEMNDNEHLKNQSGKKHVGF